MSEEEKIITKWDVPQPVLRAMFGVGDVVLPEKLNIVDGIIHYFIYAQDGTKIPMTCKDTNSNRNFVSWVQVHDQ
jgi:hypothetical protein